MFGTYTRLRVHVSASPREVIRKARLKIAEAHRVGPTMAAQRKVFYRQMLDYHCRSRQLARGL